MLAEVHDRVGAEPAFGARRGEPAVGGQVVVGRRQVRVVVDRDRVLAEARAAAAPSARRCPRRSAARTMSPVVHVQLARRRAPVLLDARAQVRGQASRTSRGSGPRRSGSGCPTSCSSVSQSGSWPPAAISAWISASPSRAATPGSSPTSYPASAIACSSATALAGVSRPTALPMRACLVGYADSISTIRLSRVRDVAQPGVPHRDPGDAGGALGVGDVDGEPVGVDLLEGERHRDEPPVELGHGDLGRDVERRQPVVARRPRWRGCWSGRGPAGSARRARRARRRPRPRRRRPPRPPAGFVPPAASTVTTMASARRSVRSSAGSAGRSEAQ